MIDSAPTLKHQYELFLALIGLIHPLFDCHWFLLKIKNMMEFHTTSLDSVM